MTTVKIATAAVGMLEVEHASLAECTADGSECPPDF